MKYEDCIARIYKHTMEDDGFVVKMEKSGVDEAAFEDFLEAIRCLSKAIGSDLAIDRRIIGYLYWVPEVMRNTQRRYDDIGIEVDLKKMATDLSETIDEMLWAGIAEEQKRFS